MASKWVVGANGHGAYVDLTDAEKVQQVADAASYAAAKAAREAVQTRISSFLGDGSRQEYVERLRGASLAEIETFVRSRLNADAVVDLATAKTYCKRVETAIVVLMDVLALMVQQ